MRTEQRAEDDDQMAVSIYREESRTRANEMD